MIENHHISSDWDRFDKYRTNAPRGLVTGFSDMDRSIIGLPNLVTVMGEPKCCKSTFVMNIAMYLAPQGNPIILLDKENGLQRTRLRMLSMLSGLTIGAIKSRSMTAEETARFTTAEAELKSLPIYYIAEEVSGPALEELIREVGKKHKQHVVLVADSLQSLVQDFKDRRASVDYWVFLFNELKLKYENFLTIIVVSEKNRQSYGTGSKSGAKESGGIEYKSEMVIDLYPKGDKDSPDADAIIAECVFNRDGDTGVIATLVKPYPYCYKLKEREFIPE